MNGLRPIALITLAICVLALLGWWQWRAQSPVATEGASAHFQGINNDVLDSPPLQSGLDELPGYAGSRACVPCHASAAERWRASHHALAERDMSVGVDGAAFASIKPFAIGAESFAPERRGDTFAVGVARDDTPSAEVLPITRVLGHAPLRQFLVAGQNGRLQTLAASWDPATREWFDVHGDDGRERGEWGHWLSRGMNWNAMCGACHNTGFFKGYEPVDDNYRTEVAEHGVACEACHGPSSNHVQRQQQAVGQAGRKGDPTVQRFDATQQLAVCGSCHSRRAEITGQFKAGDAFADHYQLSLVADDDAYYADGQVRDENYELLSFLGSAMHGSGVTCMDCHDPHSGTLRSPGNALCLRCHEPAADAAAPDILAAQHTHHANGSAGDACVGCHMPATVYMQRDSRHDHGFTVPDAVLTGALGIPNACNRCHTERSAAWSADYIERWYGATSRRASRARAMAVARARGGDASALPDLIESLNSDATPAVWRAAMAVLLGPWLFDPQVRGVLGATLKSDDAELRAAAARAVGDAAASGDAEVRGWLRELLQDRVRNVRVAAAWALRDEARANAGQQAYQDLAAMLALNADQPMGRMRLGQFAAAQGDWHAAAAQMRLAIEWDPGSAPFHRDLALVEHQRGNLAAAIEALNNAVSLAQTVGGYHYELALLLVEAGAIDEAQHAFEAAVAATPQLARAWYNLGLLLNQRGDAQRALHALQSGEAASAASGENDADIPFAVATLLVKQGRMDDARSAARRALAWTPAHTQARALLAQLNQ